MCSPGGQQCALGPWPRLEVPLSGVSTLGLPCLSSAPILPGSSGSYQAPVESWMTPGSSPSVMTAPAKIAPRSLKIRTTSPSRISRAAAFFGMNPHRFPALNLALDAGGIRCPSGRGVSCAAGSRSGAAGIYSPVRFPAILRVRARQGGAGSLRSRSSRCARNISRFSRKAS